jgi:hypothetical protein
MDLIAHQSKSLKFERGLFLIKYESAEDEENPPRVLIAPEPRNAEGIELILPAGALGPVLWSPGACMVLRATRSGRVEISVAPALPDGSVAARVQLVPLSSDPEGLASRKAADEDLDLSRFKVLAHVAGIGDVVVGPDQWVAGPTAPSRIEGIALRWPDKPKLIDLRYSVQTGGKKSKFTAMLDAGTFAGTRGAALPLVGAILEITGPGADGLRLVVDALFLGSPRMTVRGQKVVLSGPTGREPMVGIRVRMELINSSVARKGFVFEQIETASAEQKVKKLFADDSSISKPKVNSTVKDRQVRIFRNKKTIERKPVAVTRTNPLAKQKQSVRVFRKN